MTARTPSLRERAALLAGRAAGEAARRLGRGGGTALPGLVAGRIAPRLVESLARGLDRGAVTVTGTNGKTTTSHLLSAIVRAHGWRPVANRSGSNLERGITTAYVDEVARNGAAGGEPRIGVFEVDEAALPALFPRLRPRAAVFLNLFRDQLDRYGEVDSVAEGWRAMLAHGGGGGAGGERDAPVLVLNADDPSVALLAEGARGPIVAFGVEDAGAALEEREHAADARFCLCGGRFVYSAIYMGHIGRWRCPSCGRERPSPAVSAERVELGEDGSQVRLCIGDEAADLRLPLAGLYSVYNALAAAAAAHALDIPAATIVGALQQAGPAFGRQERFEVAGRQVRVLLAKNPTGLNEVIRTLTAATPPLTVLALLNDGIQDGQDVSWIYDADIERLAPSAPTVCCSGDRAEDFALRFALAGMEPADVQRDVARALDRALDATPEGARLDVVATYTAMLRVRELLAARAGQRPYWEEHDREEAHR